MAGKAVEQLSLFFFLLDTFFFLHFFLFGLSIWGFFWFYYCFAK